MNNRIFLKASSSIRKSRTSIGPKFAIFVAILGLAPLPTQAALVSISNVNNTLNGGNALFDQFGSFLSDPPATIFIGGFSPGTSILDIQTDFFSNFSTLATDFVSIGSIGAEFDTLGSIAGIHDSSNAGLDPTGVVGRDLAIWLTTSGTINDATAEHLIFVTSQVFASDPVPPSPENSYQVLLRSVGGNGTLAIGGLGNYTYDFGFGAGSELAFNTVAVPEPSSFLVLAGLAFAGLLRRRVRPRN